MLIRKSYVREFDILWFIFAFYKRRIIHEKQKARHQFPPFEWVITSPLSHDVRSSLELVLSLRTLLMAELLGERVWGGSVCPQRQWINSLKIHVMCPPKIFMVISPFSYEWQRGGWSKVSNGTRLMNLWNWGKTWISVQDLLENYCNIYCNLCTFILCFNKKWWSWHCSLLR